MTTKTLSFKTLPNLAIAEGATTPNAGSAGVWTWSTTLNRPVFWNGTLWTAGAAGAAAGANTQVQYNNAGALAGDANFSWNATTDTLSITGPTASICMLGVTTEPGTTAGSGYIYAKSIAGLIHPKFKPAIGRDFPLQSAFWQNTISIWRPSNVTAGLWVNTVGAGFGTYTTSLPTDTTIFTGIRRARYDNVITTTNQVLGQRNTDAMYFRGNALAGAGGFKFAARVGTDVWANGGRFFVGLHSGTTVISADPSALNDTVGFCCDAGDLGAISFLTRGTVATKTSTGFTLATNVGYDFYISAAPGATSYGWRIVNLNTGVEASGTATLTLPTNNTKLTIGALASNAALATASAIAISVAKIYIETDY